MKAMSFYKMCLCGCSTVAMACAAYALGPSQLVKTAKTEAAKDSPLTLNLRFASATLTADNAEEEKVDLFYTFSRGEDRYADGTPVLDGERYALVWIANTEKKGDYGFNAMGQLVIVATGVAPSADEAALIAICPATEETEGEDMHRKVPKSYVEKGGFFLYLLDTRRDGKLAEWDSEHGGYPTQGYGVIANSTGAGSGEFIKPTTPEEAGGGDPEIHIDPEQPVPVPTDARTPVICRISFSNDRTIAYVAVTNTDYYLSYAVHTNGALKAEGWASSNTQKDGGKTGDDEVEFEVPMVGGSEFFKVVNEKKPVSKTDAE